MSCLSKILISLSLLFSTAAFAQAPPLVIMGPIKNTFTLNGEITLLDDTLVPSDGWNRSEDLRSVSATGALRYEIQEAGFSRSDRLFYEIDPITRRSNYLFFIGNDNWIKKWTEDASGIHLQFCNKRDANPTLDILDVANGNYSEVNGCALRSIVMPKNQYWSFFIREDDSSNRSVLTSSTQPVYSELKPLKTTGLPKDALFDGEKIALSANSRFLAVQDAETSKYGTYLYDFDKSSIAQFKGAHAGGYSLAVPSNDGKLVTSYGPSPSVNFASDFLQVFTTDNLKPAVIFIPTLRQDNSAMWKFEDSNFTLDNSRIITSAWARARDPNTQHLRSDVDVFDVATGRHLLRLQLSSIVRFLGHDRALIQSWDDRSFRILDYGAPIPTITHRFAYPTTADLSRDLHASFAGNTLAMTYLGQTYFFELP